PITCSKEWFSSTSTNTWPTAGIFPVPSGTLRPPHAVPKRDAIETARHMRAFRFVQTFHMRMLELPGNRQVARGSGVWHRICMYVSRKNYWNLTQRSANFVPLFVD